MKLPVAEIRESCKGTEKGLLIQILAILIDFPNVNTRLSYLLLEFYKQTRITTGEVSDVASGIMKQIFGTSLHICTKILCSMTDMSIPRMTVTPVYLDL
ncbi:unnamed protein product [Acanthoscelides obtectus]|uniref:Uncharacterized protein n=1 Tax=Acanthoscelides obtectus TaxID=200917 RepID=A0A9P0PL82_ACAOB|nr:unnamed protein product [Acanthoscelides obtectus]CAK1674047.1 hypothetical protein AOBTE_LOCUS29514 [Acanthoscelides obtectus]